MTVAEKEKELVLTAPSPIPELRDYIDTYLRQYNEMVKTYEWMKPKIHADQRQEWERTINSLNKVCRVLDLGFGPCTPPKNWASGQLNQYLAPIPGHVRQAINKVEPVVGLDHIVIYDPNKEHFQRPRVTDPLAAAFIDLAGRRLHFELGRWDYDADLKFIEGSKAIEEASQNVSTLLHKTRQWHPAQPNNVQHQDSTTLGEAQDFLAKIYPYREAIIDAHTRTKWQGNWQSAVTSSSKWLGNMIS